MFRKYWVILLALIMIIAFASCNGTGSGNEESDEGSAQIAEPIDAGPVKGGNINLFSTVPDTLNPILTQNVYVQDFSHLIYEGLVKLDKNQLPVPELSDRWEISEDGLVWTFHIREGVYWHDGMPLTAEDVEFTAATILNPLSGSIYKTNFENVTTYGAVDHNTFRVFLKKPDSFTAELMIFPVIPKHYYVGENILTSPRNMAPVGTGPYRFVSYTDRKVLQLKANDEWWNAGASGDGSLGLPYISAVDIKIYENSRDSINAFQTREVDVAYIDADYTGKYIGRSDLLIKKYPGRNYDFISFNLNRPIFTDKAVRQALAYAINKNKIISGLLPGAATAADIPLTPNSWLYGNNIVSYTPSASIAREILDQSGWRDTDGVLYKVINGAYVPLKLEMLVNNDNNLRMKVANEIKEQLNEVGIILEVKSVSWEEEMKLLGNRKFDMALLGYSVPSAPQLSFAFSTAEIATGRNVSGYSNPVVDGYLDQLLLERDKEKKKELFKNVKDILTDEVPGIGLYFRSNALLFNNRIKGDIAPCQWDKYGNIAQWYIPVN